MNILQASFQASFDARVERLGEIQLAELRTMFRYFDTDGDGAVAATQACRMFALLGLDVNEEQVQELGEVYLAEFVKIVDSHSLVPLLPATQQSAESAAEPADSKAEASDPSVDAKQAPKDDGEGAADDGDVVEAAHMTPEAILQRNQALWEQEWKLLDSNRRGRVSHQELTLFLASCALVLPPADLQRFLECYGEPATTSDESDEVLQLTKAGFLKFRYNFTAKDFVPSEDGLSNSAADDHDHDAAGNSEAADRQSTDRQLTDRQSNGRQEGAEGARQLARPPSAGPSRRSDQDALSARHDHLAVDPSVFQESEYDTDNDEGEQDAAAPPMPEGEWSVSGLVVDLDPLALDE